MVSKGCPDNTTHIPPNPPAINPFKGLVCPVSAIMFSDTTILKNGMKYDSAVLFINKKKRLRMTTVDLSPTLIDSSIPLHFQL